AKTVKFQRGEPEADPPRTGKTLYLVDTSLPAGEGAQPLPYEVVAAAEKELTLKTTADLPAEGLALGPWTLHENPPGSWPAHYTQELARKEKISAEIFLIIDPLVSLSTGIASRSWIWSLTSAAII